MTMAFRLRSPRKVAEAAFETDVDRIDFKIPFAKGRFRASRQ